MLSVAYFGLRFVEMLLAIFFAGGIERIHFCLTATLIRDARTKGNNYRFGVLLVNTFLKNFIV